MGKLTCNECGVIYTEEVDIKIAKGMKESWDEMCKQDNVAPKGIAPCPNVACTGELILTI